MHDPSTFASTPSRYNGLAALRSLVATWRWRLHFRWELGRNAKANPHLLDDIGLTERQVAAEIAKPFWRA